MGRDELADLVTETAGEFAGRGLPLPDLIRAAQLGLAQAQQKFDQQSERTFEDYARWWIRRAIVRALPAEPGPPQEAVERIETAACQILREKMEAALVELTAREKEVMALRFGLDDGRPRTLGEVAESFGKTSEQIRQIEAKALRKLRQPPPDPR